MTRFINTALIGLVAFVVLLALLWLVVDPKAPGLTTADGTPGAVSIRDIEATWADGEAGRDIDVEVTLRNAGAAATVTQVTYRATFDGQVLSTSTQQPPVTLPPGTDAPLRFTVRLPDDVASRWLAASQSQGETVTLRLDGSIAVRTATLDVRLPFAWDSTGSGRLLDHLSAAAQECPGPPAPMCLRSVDAGYAGRTLQASIDLRNDLGEPVAVRSGTFRLLFEDSIVAAGSFASDLTIGPGATETLDATLAFDDGELAAWWAGHASRCESSRLALAIALDVESAEAGASAVDWELLAAPLQTNLLCKGGQA